MSERGNWLAGLVSWDQANSDVQETYPVLGSHAHGHRVTLTRDRWKEIIRYKHPALAEHVNEVRAGLHEPKVIRESIKDSDTHLYYRPAERGFVCVVVGGPIPDRRFVITAYFTKELKKGTDLWTK